VKAAEVGHWLAERRPGNPLTPPGPMSARQARLESTAPAQRHPRRVRAQRLRDRALC